MPDDGPPILKDAIAARAYMLFVRRGMKPGRDLEDWLEAERQLKDEAILRAVAKSIDPTSPPLRPTPPAPASPAERPAAGTPAKRTPKSRGSRKRKR